MIVYQSRCSSLKRLKAFPSFCKALLSSNKQIFLPQSRNMSNWQEEKETFLSMDANQKRQFYKCGSDYKAWQEIPSWKEYATQNTLSKKINCLQGQQINEAKNVELVDKIAIFLGDITTLEVDAIVNAANKSLLGGGGVDGAIHKAAGPLLKQECKTLGGCETGEAKITGGYKLPAKYVIHTVGPVGEKPGFLKNCYENSLKIMLSKNLRTIAFPCISTGIYGYPILPAAHIAVYAVRKHLEEHGDEVDKVIFCLFLEEDKIVYEGVLQSYFPIK